MQDREWVFKQKHSIPLVAGRTVGSAYSPLSFSSPHLLPFIPLRRRDCWGRGATKGICEEVILCMNNKEITTVANEQEMPIGELYKGGSAYGVTLRDVIGGRNSKGDYRSVHEGSSDVSKDR